MTDKPDAHAKVPEKAPEKLDPVKQRAAIAAEYETLLSQDQDEPSIIKALCSKHGLEPAALAELMAEARKGPGAKGAAAGPMPHPPGAVGASGKEHKTG